MQSIIYNISNAYFPVTVYLLEGTVTESPINMGDIIATNTHIFAGQYSFDDVEVGQYTVYVIDTLGCEIFINTPPIEGDCELEGEIELNLTTTTAEPTTTIDVATTELPTTTIDVATTELPTTTIEVTTTELPTTTVEVTTTDAPTTTMLPQTEFGYLYNWWASIGDTDGDNVANTSIANNGWHLPSKTEFETLMAAIGETLTAGTYPTAGVKLKSSGFTYWQDSGDPNDYGEDTYGLDVRGYGERRGGFQNLYQSTRLWSSTTLFSTTAWEFQFFYNQSYSQPAGAQRYSGQAVVLVKDDDVLTSYVGNNGVIYPTVKIGNQVWVARSLEETKYRDGTDIPLIGNTLDDNTTWDNLTTGAYSIYTIP